MEQAAEMKESRDRRASRDAGSCASAKWKPATPMIEEQRRARVLRPLHRFATGLHLRHGEIFDPERRRPVPIPSARARAHPFDSISRRTRWSARSAVGAGAGSRRSGSAFVDGEVGRGRHCRNDNRPAGFWAIRRRAIPRTCGDFRDSRAIPCNRFGVRALVLSCAGTLISLSWHSSRSRSRRGRAPPGTRDRRASSASSRSTRPRQNAEDLDVEALGERQGADDHRPRPTGQSPRHRHEREPKRPGATLRRRHGQATAAAARARRRNRGCTSAIVRPSSTRTSRSPSTTGRRRTRTSIGAAWSSSTRRNQPGRRAHGRSLASP